jgi:hypothetical protein
VGSNPARGAEKKLENATFLKEGGVFGFKNLRSTAWRVIWNAIALNVFFKKRLKIFPGNTKLWGKGIQSVRSAMPKDLLTGIRKIKTVSLRMSEETTKTTGSWQGIYS